MVQELPPNPDDRLADNILVFARVLRGAGMPVGSDRVLNGIAAVSAAGIGNREDFYWTLFTNLVSRRDQLQLFDQAFHLFWRNPRLMERMLSTMLPRVELDSTKDDEQINRRLAEALLTDRPSAERSQENEQQELLATLTYSAQETLRQKDFEQMSAQELLEARRVIATLKLPLENRPTRRFAANPRGRVIDMRATLRASLRSEATIPLRFKARRLRHPPLVILCDISGSMSSYSRMFLHFMHTVTNDRERVQSFVFATRLSNITHQLARRDVDEALADVSQSVQDWSGGTRIGACLEEFNRLWSRRVLSQGAVTLIMTDGLDREDDGELSRQMERLAKSSRRLIWLNPLLRYAGFEPRARGIRAMLGHVDEFRAAHNLDSLAELVAALGDARANAHNVRRLAS